MFIYAALDKDPSQGVAPSRIPCVKTRNFEPPGKMLHHPSSIEVLPSFEFRGRGGVIHEVPDRGSTCSSSTNGKESSVAQGAGAHRAGHAPLPSYASPSRQRFPSAMDDRTDPRGHQDEAAVAPSASHAVDPIGEKACVVGPMRLGMSER